jgi:hypothetical protein
LQAPQLFTSFWISVSQPSRLVFSLLQLWKLEPQETEHDPDEHDPMPEPALLQLSPQAPQ